MATLFSGRDWQLVENLEKGLSTEIPSASRLGDWFHDVLTLETRNGDIDAIFLRIIA